MADPLIQPQTVAEPAPRVLLVDDDPLILGFFQEALQKSGYQIETAQDGVEAAALASKKGYDLVVSDVSMPGMDGIQLLRKIRDVDLDVPVIIVTGGPTLDTAVKAIEYGAFRYLSKPVDATTLRKVVAYGVNMHRMTRAKREALKLVAGTIGMPGDRAGLEVSFERALATIVPAFQPIISWSKKSVIAYEVLVRNAEPSLARPLELFEAAEKLNRVEDVGWKIRTAVAERMSGLKDDTVIYVNLHPRDMNDERLYQTNDPLAVYAPRVVLEVSERASLEIVRDARSRIGKLRTMGYRIAMDDLGAGHAGLATFAHLEPDIVKIDMSLIRGADREPIRRKLIESIARLGKDLSMQVISEGIETSGERDAVLQAGCDLLQGYYFGKPEPDMNPVKF